MLIHKESYKSKPEFDLKKSIEDTIQEMIKAKDDDPNLLIPSSFLENYNSKEMTALIKTAYEYCTALFKIEQTCESKDQKLNSTSFQSSEFDKIREIST